MSSSSRLRSIPYTVEKRYHKPLDEDVDDLNADLFGTFCQIVGATVSHPWKVDVPKDRVTTYGDLLDDLCACNPSTVWIPDIDVQASIVPYTVTMITGAQRKAATSFVTLAPEEIVYDWRFDLTASDRITTVTYTDELGDSATIDFLQGSQPPTSTTIDCPFLTAADAETNAAASYGPRINPSWRVGTITVTNAGLTNTRAATLGNAFDSPGSLITLPTLATGAPTVFFVEGITATYTGTDGAVVIWELTLAARDLLIPPDMWTEAPATLTWATTSATLTWTGALRGDI